MMGQIHPIGGRATVLVVEDEALISEMVTEELEDQGFTVFVASNAADALRYIESGASIDALFTDVHLPGGMSGAQLAQRVREMRPELPIVYASGCWHPDKRDPLVTRSVFLEKPYDPRDAGTLLSRLVTAH
jgi:CheY-like chemotaxis protein